eukprot:132427-Chlamydomonas_euryale.AAC.3
MQGQQGSGGTRNTSRTVEMTFSALAPEFEHAAVHTLPLGAPKQAGRARLVLPERLPARVLFHASGAQLAAADSSSVSKRAAAHRTSARVAGRLKVLTARRHTRA